MKRFKRIVGIGLTGVSLCVSTPASAMYEWWYTIRPGDTVSEIYETHIGRSYYRPDPSGIPSGADIVRSLNPGYAARDGGQMAHIYPGENLLLPESRIHREEREREEARQREEARREEERQRSLSPLREKIAQLCIEEERLKKEEERLFEATKELLLPNAISTFLSEEQAPILQELSLALENHSKLLQEREARQQSLNEFDISIESEKRKAVSAEEVKKSTIQEIMLIKEEKEQFTQENQLLTTEIEEIHQETTLLQQELEQILQENQWLVMQEVGQIYEGVK